MQNLDVKVVGSKLTIVCDLSKPGEPSKSGKSEVLASTHGNYALGSDLFVGVNVFRKS